MSTLPLLSQYPMRRHKRELSPADSLALLRQGQWGVLSLALPDGSPYGIPLNYALWEETTAEVLSPMPRLIFHCASEGLKLHILHDNPRACFTVVPFAEVRPEALSTRYQSVMAFGTVRRLSAGEGEHDNALVHLGQRYSAAFPAALSATLKKSGTETTILLMDIQHLRGKFNPAR